MPRIQCLAFVTSFLLIGSTAGAQEQPGSIVPQQKVSGTIGASNPQFVDGRPFRIYRFNADSGARYTVSLHSSEFDALVKIGRTIAGVTEYVADDDDSGPGTDALVNFRANGKEPYLIIVTTATRKTGAFELEVDRLAELPPVVRRIAVGDSVASMFSQQTSTWRGSGAPYDLYTLRAQGGHHLRIQVSADSLRAGFALGQLQGTQFVAFANGTDSSDTPATTAQLARNLATVRYFTPPVDRDYAIMVVGATSASGRYGLKVSEIQALPDTTGPRTLGTGKEAKGWLIGDSPNPHRLGSRFQDWTFSARQGERLAAALSSAQFDTYLILGRSSPTGSFFPMDTSDDAPGEGDNSRIVFSPPTTGDYVLRVKGGGSGGEYTLRVVPVGPRHLQRRTAVAGAEVHGTLGEMDSVLADGSPYQEWVIQAAAGDRLTITMRSSDFDTFLSVGQFESQKYVEWSANDDAPEEATKNHVSRVIIAPQKSGEYVIRVNSTSKLEQGAYTLTVDRSHGAIQTPKTAGR